MWSGQGWGTLLMWTACFFIIGILCIFMFKSCTAHFDDLARLLREDKEGHYEMSGSKVLVYENGDSCTYDVDPVTGMVSRIVHGARSVDMEPLNITKEELFKGLEERGITLYRGSEDEGAE